MKSGKVKLTPVSMLHYIRLMYRSALFIVLLISYILFRVRSGEAILDRIERLPAVLMFFWAIFVLEMVLRFFPSRLESPGCQKQFRHNYVPTGESEIIIQDNHSTMLIALIWITFNAGFGALHMMNILDDGIMILLSSAYSVCDMICILFFCPFQSWFMKNKCCSCCRIYNWDYAMMFTPLFFVSKTYTWSLLILSLALMARWEITYYMYPERFSENTNGYLKCSNCTEKLCTHKTQLRRLWVRIEEYAQKRLQQIKQIGRDM